MPVSVSVYIFEIESGKQENTSDVKKATLLNILEFYSTYS